MSSTSLVRSSYDRIGGYEPPRRRGGFFRFVVAVGIGVGGTLAWQAYGDQIREKLAVAYPQLGWLAPHLVSSSTGAASSSSRGLEQQLQEMALNLATMRQRVEQLSVQVANGQDQLNRDIGARVQASEHDILDRMAQPRTGDAASATAVRKPPQAAPTQVR